MKKIVMLFLYLISVSAFSQKFFVEDINGLKIVEVAFYAKEKCVYSDVNGIVDLSVFNKGEFIKTSHISFLDLEFSKSEILNNTIVLLPKNYSIQEISINKSLNLSKNYSYKKLTTNEIRSSLSSNPAELLEKSTTINVQKSQSGGGSPNIRGFEANRILLVLDGIKLNNLIYRSGHLQNILSVDPYIIESLTVLHGPSAVVYGSGSLGGGIIMNTISPEKSKENKSVFIQQYETASSSVLSHFHSIYKVKRSSFLSSISLKQYGNTKMGKNRFHQYEDWGTDTFATNGVEQLFGEYNQIDLTQKIHHQINAYSSVAFNSQFSTTSNINRFDKLNDVYQERPKFKHWYYGPQKRILQSIKYNSFKKTKVFDKLNVHFSYQKLEESRHKQLFLDDQIIRRYENVHVLDSRLEFFKSTSLFDVKYGISSRNEQLSSSAFSENENNPDEKNFATTRYPDNGSKLINVSTFLLSESQISKKIKWLNGVRFDYEKINAAFSNNNPFVFEEEILNKNLNLSASSVISYDINKNNFLSLSVFNAFRNPNVDDLGKVFSKSQGVVVVPNIELNPEKVISTEMHLNHKKEGFNLALTIFYNTLKDAIEKRPYLLNENDSILYDGEMMATIANTNIKNAEIKGFEIKMNRKLTKKIDFDFYSSYINGKSSDSLPLSHIPPFSMKAKISYSKNKKTKWSLYSNYNGAKKREDFDISGTDNLEEATINGTPAWYTINILYSKTIDILTLSIACENILDAHYKTFASGISAPGRNFILNLQAVL